MLERTHNGILIRPSQAQSWDEIYAEKLKIGSTSVLNLSEVNGDDLSSDTTDFWSQTGGGSHLP